MTGIDVVYSAVDELPGGSPVLYAVRDGRLDIVLSRAASVDEIVEALPEVYRALTDSLAVRRVKRTHLPPTGTAWAAVLAPLTALAGWVAMFDTFLRPVVGA